MDRIIISNACIITMENNEGIIKNGYILIENDTIKDMGSGNFKGSLENTKLIDACNCAVLPGLINCHTHVPMTLLRGYGEGLPLMKWLNEKIWPFEAKLTKEDIYIGACLGIIEMIKSGTTSFVDMYYGEDEIGKASEKCGIRGFLGIPVIGDNYASQIEESIKIYNDFKKSQLVSMMIAPHSPYTCSKQALAKCSDTARKYKLPIHIHIAETKDEVNIIKDRYGMSPFELCDETGIFDKTNVIAAHCVHMQESDISLIQKHKVTVVNNPQSNMKLSSGICPVTKLIGKGINVALGTDGASSNNNLNMIDEMQSASLLQKLSTSDATALGAYETMKLATINGAKAVGMGEHLGVLKTGCKADMIIMKLNKPHLIPVFDLYSNIVYSAQGSDISTVIINGNVVMENYKIKTIDEDAVIEAACKCVESIMNR